jgi:uncharacterized protein
MFARHTEKQVHQLLNEFRVVYLTGPRQSGKTTLAQQVANARGMTFLSLDEPAILAAARNDPLGLLQSFQGQALVIDEFQLAPALVPAIKRMSDGLARGQRGRFLLTGSADIFSSARVQESLPGHMARVELYPLALNEKSDGELNLIDFLINDPMQVTHRNFKASSRGQLASWILGGGYPEVQDKSSRAQAAWYRSYVQGRLFKDFDSLYAARGDYHDRLKALIPYLAGLSGNLVKYASIANDLGQNDKVVKSYLGALEWMFIFKRLPPFIKNSAKRETLGMSKLHSVDTGLACHLLGIRSGEQLLASQWYGALLENLVLMECFKHQAWAQEDVQLMHYRDLAKNEVDIVMQTPDGELIGLVVKASASVSEADFKGLRAFAASSPKSFQCGVLFYSGAHRLPFSFEGRRFLALPLDILTM